MTGLNRLIKAAANKEGFQSIQDYASFSLRFLEYVEENKQAEIVAQNDHRYSFFQFGKEASFKVSRPFNSDLLYRIGEADEKYQTLADCLNELRQRKAEAAIDDRNLINRAIYTLQQSIGFALDAGTVKGVEPNVARKVNGDLFERLICLIISDIGLRCRSGVVKVPVIVEGEPTFTMCYQHDLIVEDDSGEVRIIGSAKTTSKDRIDKTFVDKFLYCKLTDTCIPHIAVFLHDVQRKGTKTGDNNNLGISSTFLPGHFKGYTVKLNPLDGVYYFDPRPVMQTDEVIRQQIRNFDVLLCQDIWAYM